ncbi:hypothetical protein [Herbaspirillum chlorophenolicum]|uniref:hypothetical protein n=1 Tax=Herbaspirillum chlorophenolicum TaxID=211589 RepID=UPI0012E27982|nr:hypothetical protein [Herbaspirillum chlorophenolicum]
MSARIHDHCGICRKYMAVPQPADICEDCLARSSSEPRGGKIITKVRKHAVSVKQRTWVDEIRNRMLQASDGKISSADERNLQRAAKGSLLDQLSVSMSVARQEAGNALLPRQHSAECANKSNSKPSSRPSRAERKLLRRIANLERNVHTNHRKRLEHLEREVAGERKLLSRVSLVEQTAHAALIEAQKASRRAQDAIEAFERYRPLPTALPLGYCWRLAISIAEMDEENRRNNVDPMPAQDVPHKSGSLTFRLLLLCARTRVRLFRLFPERFRPVPASRKLAAQRLRHGAVDCAETQSSKDATADSQQDPKRNSR